jgi:hypothetical protein
MACLRERLFASFHLPKISDHPPCNSQVTEERTLPCVWTPNPRPLLASRHQLLSLNRIPIHGGQSGSGMA